MNTEELRADEIACLLGAESELIEAAKTAPAAAEHRAVTPAHESTDAVGHGESLADLPFSADLKFTFQSVSEELADRLSRRLNQLLHCDVAVKCGAIIADTFAAWILGMEQPTCFLVASLPPLDGKLLLELPPEFVCPALEQLLGGRPSVSGTLRRPLTELEQRLSLRLSDAILESYAAAWQSIINLQPGVERMENNPRVVRCLPALEPLLITSLAISFEGVSTTIRMAVPVRTAAAACDGPHGDHDRPARPRDQVTQPISASLELTLDESTALEFQGGADVCIASESLASVELTRQGVPLGRGELIEFHGRRAIRIRETFPPDRGSGV